MSKTLLSSAAGMHITRSMLATAICFSASSLLATCRNLGGNRSPSRAYSENIFSSTLPSSSSMKASYGLATISTLHTRFIMRSTKEVSFSCMSRVGCFVCVVLSLCSQSYEIPITIGGSSPDKFSYRHVCVGLPAGCSMKWKSPALRENDRLGTECLVSRMCVMDAPSPLAGGTAHVCGLRRTGTLTVRPVPSLPWPPS